ncbi:MAG: glycogen debranching protein GlgX [Deltaproteobacteria bacterium]|nr:glycogen debranching protein GlgX [Deltaproteobacteria bacterium]
MSGDPKPGRPHPLGASPADGGVNFSVWARNAARVELLFFDRAEDPRPSRVLALDPLRHRTYHYWHALVPGVSPGQRYGWRATGPFDPRRGLRFDGQKLLLDPYGRAVVIPPGYDREAAARPGDNAGTAMKSAVVDLSAYDWEGDEPLRRPFSKTVIYELHVRGFTRHPSSGLPEQRRGTYAGLVEKIPHLQALGVNAVELMPVFAFDRYDAPAGRVNYWGYSPVAFFAPHPAYAAAQGPLAAIDEFRDMVKALHRAGIEVILDVVYNHTAEGDERGPTLSFRGLDNVAYYILDKDWSRYSNYTGCGNTLKAAHPVVRRLISDSLRYWVGEMHVDGFRFDLASVLSRDEAGQALSNPPIVWQIESDPLLAGSKLIAEAWDAAGLYQVGHWVGDAWKEWNGRFRDDVRAFLRGDPGTVNRFADRLFASPDLYAAGGHQAEQSVNFVTCHDGFTLADLVTYEHKRNEGNGEGNRDGNDDNRAWNCGAEGPSDDPRVLALRARQIRNFITVNLLSAGVPMLSMGDEVGRSQGGNNNAYCQDNEVSWLDWTLAEKNADLLRFARKAVGLRVAFDPSEPTREVTLAEFLVRSKVEWHGVRLGAPDWSEGSRSLAVGFSALDGSVRLHCIFNAWTEPLQFELPPSEEGWRLLVDTALPPPDDTRGWDEALRVEGRMYLAQAHSVVMLGTG